MRYGYLRASKTVQGRKRQLALLRAAECDRIVEERKGAVFGRLEELGLLIARLAPGDTLLVSCPDVLSGSHRRLFRILSAIEARGARFESVAAGPPTLALPAGYIAAADLSGAANAEREAVSERIRAGRQRARRRGVQLGRPSKMTALQQQEAIDSWLAGEKVMDIAARYGVSRTVITGLTAEIRRRPVADIDWEAGLLVAAE